MCDLFILDNSIGRDVGDYPQLADFPKDYDYDAIDSVYELKNYRFQKEKTNNRKQLQYSHVISFLLIYPYKLCVFSHNEEVELPCYHLHH